MKTNIEKDPLIKRVNALLALTIEELLSKKSVGIGQIYKAIHGAGLTPTEIGQIAGRRGKDVSSTLAEYEKRKKSKKKKGENDG